MKKSSYNWIWKWHLIGGLVSFPIVFILALTGIIYLFKDQYEKPRYASIKEVEVKSDPLTYEQQWQIAQEHWDQNINTMIVPSGNNQATVFTSGRFSGKKSLFVNPFTGEVTGRLAVRDTDMFKVRKLHGELLMGSFGTKIIELVGSWLVVLIISGLFIFFPRKKKDWSKLFRIRFNAPKKVFFRDLHMVSGFWFSILLLLILAGGMPWTDVWGDGFKWIQKQTGTGYPPTWNGRGLTSNGSGSRIALDQVVDYAHSLQLPGEVSITLPKSPQGVFSIHNVYHPELTKQVAVHLDQYSGRSLARLEWEDVGILMRGRMWAMAFHQGQFGTWNWVLMLVTAFGLLALSSAAVVAFFLRKKPGTWHVPTADTYDVRWSFYLLVGMMGIFLPLFGVSVVVIWVVEYLRALGHKRSLKKSVSINA